MHSVRSRCNTRSCDCSCRPLCRSRDPVPILGRPVDKPPMANSRSSDCRSSHNLLKDRTVPARPHGVMDPNNCRKTGRSLTLWPGRLSLHVSVGFPRACPHQHCCATALVSEMPGINAWWLPREECSSLLGSILFPPIQPGRPPIAVSGRPPLPGTMDIVSRSPLFPCSGYRSSQLDRVLTKVSPLLLY